LLEGLARGKITANLPVMAFALVMAGKCLFPNGERVPAR